eukprot:TRINITY_DN8340_c0_g1_i1.p1 TRINITY_DN8340_c0_g1~~TRINITY_DN8340_c0_g1_i1.p1  ORF type:complete len:455 (-),score=80.39 TRINITY_DN8340_c0_g1_i1:12-1238(-)
MTKSYLHANFPFFRSYFSNRIYKGRYYSNDTKSFGAFFSKTECDLTTDLKRQIFDTYQESLQFMEEGKFGQALELCEKALSYDPNNPFLLCQKGAINMSYGQLDEALSYFEKALQRSPNDPLILINKANALLQVEKPNEALTVVNEAIQSSPTFFNAWKTKGLILLKLEEYNEAEVCFSRAIDLAPQVTASHEGRVEALRCLGLYEEVVVGLEGLIKLDSKNVEYWKQLGIAHYNMGDIQKAIDSLKTGVDIGTSDVHVFDLLAWIMTEQQMPDEAIQFYDKVLELDPSNEIAWRGKGQNYFTKQQYAEALRCHDKILEKRPDDITALFSQGLIYFNMKKYKRALDICRKVLNLDPSLADGWAIRGDILKHTGQFGEALDSVEKALALDPENEIAINLKQELSSTKKT